MLLGKGLNKTYAGQKIISDLDIQLEPGKISVIIGPSGSGKTSLIKILALLDLPDFGAVSLDGLEYSFPIQDRKKLVPPWPKVTVVFQQLFLWPHLTLLQNITLPMTSRGQRIDDQELQNLIDLFEMASFIDRYPNQCSVGQRQRVALARALLLKPKYLLLDEITSSLDVEQIAIILGHLKELAQSGIGILIVTHLLHFAHDVADNVIFLDNGQIIESGGKEVLASPSKERVRRFLSVIESVS